jgi:shikimate kinase
MIETLINTRARQKPPLIVELVGLAGAGKTTLSRAISQRDKKIRVANDIELRKMVHIPIFIGYASILLPLFLRRCQHSRWFTWDEIKSIVYLKGWPHILRQPISNSNAVILLDHGPVFKLTTLNAFGPERLKSHSFEQWWHSTFEQWARTLDRVIWLDAPDVLLMERINTRSQKHAVKGKSKREVSNFLDRYRTSYEQILSKIRTHGGPKALQLNTNQTSIEQIVDEILFTFNLNLSES